MFIDPSGYNLLKDIEQGVSDFNDDYIGTLHTEQWIQIGLIAGTMYFGGPGATNLILKMMLVGALGGAVFGDGPQDIFHGALDSGAITAGAYISVNTFGATSIGGGIVAGAFGGAVVAGGTTYIGDGSERDIWTAAGIGAFKGGGTGYKMNNSPYERAYTRVGYRDSLSKGAVYVDDFIIGIGLMPK